MTLTMPELAAELVGREPDRLALAVDGGGPERQLTLRQWHARAGAVARGLVDRQVRPGDRIGLLVDGAGWIDYAVGSLAVQLAGATVVGLSRRLSDRELAGRMEHCGVAGLLHGARVTPPRRTAWAAPVAELAGGTGKPPEVVPGPEELAEIIYTSGTTGAAKPVAVSHANLTHGQGGARSALFEGVDGVLAAVPAGTNAGHSAVMLALTGPATVRLLSRQDPATVAAMIERLRVGLAIVPSPVAVRLVGTGLHRRHDLSGVAAFMLGSAPAPVPTVRRLSEAAPAARVLIGYGSTESAPAFSHLAVSAWNEHRDPDYFRHPERSSVGVPRGGTEAVITGSAGEPLPPGRRGEIWLRSPAPPRTYYRDPAATAATFRDGWTRMGDLGHVDEDGYLYVFDRASDVIDRPGRTVSSLRVEAALYEHPDVVQAAAFGLPDPGGGGDLVAAAVELDPASSTEQLLSVLAERLEPDEQPARIIVVDALPDGVIGKVLKRELRQQLSAG